MIIVSTLIYSEHQGFGLRFVYSLCVELEVLKSTLNRGLKEDL